MPAATAIKRESNVSLFQVVIRVGKIEDFVHK